MNPEQSIKYYEEQGNLASPMSPKDWLTKQQQTPTLPMNTLPTEGVTKDDIPKVTDPNTLFKADPNPFIKEQRDLLNQRQAQQQAFLQAQTPTAQEQQINEQMNKLNADARQAIATAEQSGETQRFAGGETARVSRQATIQMQGLSDQLNALTAQRSVRIDALKTQMDFNKENMDAINNLAKLSQPDVISTGIDKKTGEIYSLVKDPQTGAITQNVVGQVTPEEAKLDLLKTFVDSNGNEVASFLGPNNTIVNRVLGMAQVKTPVLTTEPIVSPTTGQTLEYGTPEYLIQRLLNTSSSKLKPVASERNQLGKFDAVIAQTSNLVQSLKSTDTGPITGFLKGLNPYDFDARAVNAQLQALVPGVARGVYGEVGVLTDTDIKNYIQTLPNLKSTADQNNFVALLTLQNARRSYESTLLNLANSNVNVSGFVDSYKDIVKRVEDIEKDLGVTKAPPAFISDEEFDKLPTTSLTGGITLYENPSGFFDGFLNMFGLKKK